MFADPLLHEGWVCCAGCRGCGRGASTQAACRVAHHARLLHRLHAETYHLPYITRVPRPQVLEWLDHGSRTADGAHLIDTKAEGKPRFDLIFLDIMMQRSNGEDVCRRLRAAGITTPVVAATGNGVKEDLDRYREAGFSTVMLKPFSSSTVADMLCTLLPSHGPQLAPVRSHSRGDAKATPA